METVIIENQKFIIVTYSYGFRVYEETLGSRYRTSAFLKNITEAREKLLQWSNS